jgi:hypothetical protein
MNISRMSTWLSRHMGYTVAAVDIKSHKVTSCKLEDHFRPVLDVLCCVCHLKWMVPNHSSVSLLTFVSMLRLAAFIALYKKLAKQISTYRLNLPIDSSCEIKLARNSVAVVHGAALNMACNH